MADEETLSQEEINAIEGQDASEEVDDEERDGGAEDSAEHPDDEEEGGEVAADPGEAAAGRVLSRGERRFQRIRNELKEARAEAQRTRAELEGRITQLQQGFQQPQPQMDPRWEAERLASLSPEERMQEQLTRATEQHKYELARMRYEQADLNDQTEFKQRGTSDKRVSRYAQEVEQTLAGLRQQGMNPKRETIYFYLLGRKIAQAQGQPARQQKEGQERLRRATTRPTNAGGDVPARRGGKTLEQRLDGVLL